MGISQVPKCGGTTILLVATLDEARSIKHDHMRVMSCSQGGRAFDGLCVTAVYATALAKEHRDYDKALGVLRRNAAKTTPAGLERVI